jgi:hypothetical protein
MYSLHNFVSRGPQRTSIKIGKNVTLYHQEEKTKLDTFCTQSVIQGLPTTTFGTKQQPEGQ